MCYKLIVLSFFILLSDFAFSQKEKSKPNKEKYVVNPFLIVEEMPDYPGGPKALKQFLIDNTQYPEEAKKNNIKGTIPIQFVVEADGSITHIKVFRGLGYGCDEEVLRVIKLMPTWEPGYQNGVAVPVYFYLAVKFGEEYGKKKLVQTSKKNNSP